MIQDGFLSLSVGWWKYLLVSLVVLVEGEIFLIIVGTATAAKLLNYPLAIIAATIGVIFHDNGIFTLSKFLGKKIIQKRASWRYKSQKLLKTLDKYLDKYEFLVIFSVRFLYGIRTIAIVVLGLSKVSRFKFFFFDASSSFVWSFLYISLGFLFGNFILEFINHIDITHWIFDNKYLVVLMIVLAVVIIYFSYRLLRLRLKLKRRKNE